MAITVQHGKDDVTIHTGATRWHVDDNERLHIIGDNGNIASYNRGYWANVVQDEPHSRITAVATLNGKGESNAGQTQLNFNADYNDERNKAWAKYTPGLSVIMHVTDEVAENFDQGSRYLLPFIKQD
ncbi:hypothetical protein PP636_gp08 [Arthrobacter phage Hestia]|uniref:Uncharacterized protein n=1 Tax=Arthrobacter phage Hestia TaxID=2419609 RepID=A0A3G3M3G9_9CAUD|nr:hypothetical protein PP636_gp08 [Arthrobacter phage Hestia]AYR00963.1 hypothetical protein PBI_HESTIA_87 [Arthrobacter phage Hestia]